MTRRTQTTHARWQEGLSRLRAYAHTHGAANPHTRAVVDGFRLGRWAAVQRERYWANRLPPEHVAALQGVPGWDWGRTNADRWSEGLTHLRSYLDEHATTAVDTRTVHEGFELGGWVARRRSNYHQGTLSPTRTTALEALPGWVWTRTEDRWPHGLKALRTYVTKHGTAAVPADATHRRYPLGRWVAARRAQYQRGTLSPEQITTLQALPGWVWDVKASRWDQGLRLLTAYAHRTGAPNPDSFYIEAAEDNFTLGAWAMSRRKEYRLGVLFPHPHRRPESDPRVGMESPRRRLAPHVYPPRTGRPPPRDRRSRHPNRRHRRSNHRSLGDDPTHPTPPRPPHHRPGRSPASPTRLELDTARPPTARIHSEPAHSK